MRVGDIITKEQFLRLAPLGLQIASTAPEHSNVILGYCHKNYEAFTKYQEQGNSYNDKDIFTEDEDKYMTFTKEGTFYVEIDQEDYDPTIRLVRLLKRTML